MNALQEKTLKKNLSTKYPRAGVWIDHTKAEIVVLTGEQVDVKTVYSDAERKHRSMGGAHSSTQTSHMASVSELKMNARRENTFKRYYEEVSEELKGVDQFYVIGPDGAKSEFKIALEKHPDLLKKMVAIETSDKISEAQLVSQVKRFFQVHPTV